jgi:hypothetical protein
LTAVPTPVVSALSSWNFSVPPAFQVRFVALRTLFVAVLLRLPLPVVIWSDLLQQVTIL